MPVSAQLKRSQQQVSARLYRAYSGVTSYTVAEWGHPRPGAWVIDYINQGQQPQRIGTGKKFTRLSGIAALYAPGTHWHEWRTAGGSLNESYLIFDLSGELADAFRSLAGRSGYCHFRDPDQLIGRRLHQIAELLFQARPGAPVFAHGVLLELLGLVLTAQPVSPRLREVRETGRAREARHLPGRVESYIRQHITQTIRVAALARCVGLSASAFAHAYPRLAGEPPYRTVLRLKVQAAKQLLLQDGLSVKATAAQLGFPSEFQFSRTFKLVEGIAPKRYVQALTSKSRVGGSAGE